MCADAQASSPIPAQAEVPADAGEKPVAVPFLQLFRYADALDRLAFVAIAFCALFSGVVIPLTSLVLGELLNGSIDGAVYSSRVDTASLHMALLGAGCFLSLGGGGSTVSGLLVGGGPLSSV